jgi:hypothetical protein
MDWDADLIRETVDGLVGEDPPGQPWVHVAMRGASRSYTRRPDEHPLMLHGGRGT